jgi:hypothetical protein
MESRAAVADDAEAIAALHRTVYPYLVHRPTSDTPPRSGRGG